MVSVWTLDPAAANGTCTCEEREEAFFWSPGLLIPVSEALGIQGHRGNPEENGLNTFLTQC
jgi:hypothetical protein